MTGTGRQQRFGEKLIMLFKVYPCRSVACSPMIRKLEMINRIPLRHITVLRR
jgi:hypothetical protein